MISDERLAKSLSYMSETDSEAALLKTEVERAVYKLKLIKATIFTHEDGTVAERQAKAETATETQQAVADHLQAMADYESVANKRKTEGLIVEVYRTESANRRTGNI